MSPNHEGETGDGYISGVEMVLDKLVYIRISSEYTNEGLVEKNQPSAPTAQDRINA